MTRTRFTFAIVLVVAGLVVAGCGGSTTSRPARPPPPPPRARHRYGRRRHDPDRHRRPGFDISMTGTDGLTPGEYTINVSDKSEIHNFHLTGPGVDMKTEVSEEGDTSGRSTCRPASTSSVCDPHASQMNGSFTVSG